jgi:hypothetical protein
MKYNVMKVNLKDENCICKFKNWIYYSENKNVQILKIRQVQKDELRQFKSKRYVNLGN